MYINVMRYRTGKFAISATQTAKNGKTINKEDEIKDMKGCFGAYADEYRVDRKEGVTHHWTFQSMDKITEGLNDMSFPSQDNEELE
jgi:hypothetical protein